MAILVKVDEVKNLNEEREKFKLNKFSAIIAFIISIFIVKLIFTLFRIDGLLGEFEDLLVLLISLLLTYIYSKRRYLIKEHTKKGFIKVLKEDDDKSSNILLPEELHTLSDKNYIIKNLRFKNSGGINFIHTAVINKDAVFIIYIRNDMGDIKGSKSDNKWSVIFEGKKKKVDNPINIVKKQENRLREYLKREGFIIDVKSIIYYSNKDINFNIIYDEKEVSIFNEETAMDLVNYIKGYKGNNNVDFESVLDIIIKISK